MDNSPLLGRSRKTSFDIPGSEKLDKDYGFNFEYNCKLTESNPEVSVVWKWFSYCKTSGIPYEEKSESTRKDQGLYPVYQSEERAKCLKICEWDFFSSSFDFNAQGNIAKSQLILYSIFSFNLSFAIQNLEDHILIPLLQNYQENDTNYLNLCKTLAKTQSESWVKAILYFLSGPKSIPKVLEQLSLTDSAGFALMFLNDSDLKQHLKSLQAKGEDSGNLQSLILSGFHSETPVMLKKFYERTSDIQTVAILSLFALQFTKSDVLDGFVSGFKSHLSRFEMFNLKCLFEIEEAKMLGKKKERGKGIRCYYCGNPIATCDILSASSKKGDFQAIEQPIFNHCPSCPGSLPKCCVCLTSLKSVNPYFLNKTGKDVSVGLFVWCEKCHHGGHSKHILDWFNENSACPVYGCKCPCGSLD